MRYIEHIFEPDKLLLSWQTSQEGEGRTRMFVAELIRNGNDANLIYLLESKEFERATSLGFKNYPGFSASQKKHENILFAFVKRLPPRTRGDFVKYLNALRLKPDAEVSDFALLGYSRAKLPDDDFTIINPFENAIPPFEFLLEVQGYRYYKDAIPITSLKMEQTASFQPEPENKVDPNAIKIIINGMCAGYVSRGLTNSFHKWFAAGYTIEASLERINGTGDKPEIYLYVSVNATR